MFSNKAMAYAEIGWHVFPLRPGTNEFFASENDRHATAIGGGGGFYWGTTDADKIAEWDRRWPDANIALRTGEKSGAVVLDMDFGKPGSNTQEAVDRLADRGFLLPKCNVIARTPSGGTHWYYRYTGPLGSSTSRLARNLMGVDEAGKPRKSFIDIKADGGLTVLPPTSVEGKGVYTWELPPWDDDGRPKRLVPCPRWIIDQLKPPPPPIRPYVPPVRTNIGEIPEWRLQKVATMAPDTGRNSELFTQAAQARDWGHSEAEIMSKFLDAASACGLDRRGAESTIKQALLEKNRKQRGRVR